MKHSPGPRRTWVMNGNSDDFVAVIAILVIFGMPLAYAISHRWWSHQERLEMIRRGITPPPDARSARRMYRTGFEQFTYAQPGGVPPHDADLIYPDRMLRKGVTIAMIGLALVIGLSFINPSRPGPWLLGGLIPMFVGLAQIILALMSGARFGQWTQVPPGMSSPMPPPPAEGPYGWRPGPTTGLEAPTRPPDIKQ